MESANKFHKCDIESGILMTHSFLVGESEPKKPKSYRGILRKENFEVGLGR